MRKREAIEANQKLLKACEVEAQKVQERHEITHDDEAMKALRYLASKGYTSEQIVEQWWRMERGK